MDSFALAGSHSPSPKMNMVLGQNDNSVSSLTPVQPFSAKTETSLSSLNSSFLFAVSNQTKHRTLNKSFSAAVYKMPG